MNPPGSVTTRIEDCLRRIDDGDEAAINELIDCAFERLVDINNRIVGGMVSKDRGIRASDVFQDAYERLSSAIKKDNVNPKTAGEFMGLAARHIRFQVLDMLRQAKRRNAETLDVNAAGEHTPNDDSEMWICLFEAFNELTEEQRAVADLLFIWIDGKAVPNMTQYEAAEVLGISRDRVKDLWRNARIRLKQKCKDFDPNAI